MHRAKYLILRLDGCLLSEVELGFLKNILFYGEGYVETSLTLDVAGSCTLTESDAV